MGVFKWLRRERVTVSTHRSPSPGPSEHSQDIGTIRTDEYKRDLAEFQARRSSGPQLPDTPVKKKCGRHSLPISCTNCADPDRSFNYEKKSAVKYKKKKQRARSANPDDHLPNIQFLFQNQVFMPGTITAYSEPRKRYSRRVYRSPENFPHKHLDFKEDEPQVQSPPFFYKNNSLPYDIKTFLDSKGDVEEVDGMKATEDINDSSHSSSDVAIRDGSSKDNLWEVMSELRNFDRWADEQLQVQSANLSKTDDSKSETSTYGLSLASASNLDVNVDKTRVWSVGKWGVVPVQIKALPVSVEQVRKKKNTEINILRKCRHPNIILLMGLYPDVHNNVNIICERCVDTLYDILHDEQGRILSAQTSVQYALEIANALVFLRMQGYLHTALSSKSIMITRQDSAKLSDLGPCVKLPKEKKKEKLGYEMYSPEPQYVNIDETSHNNPESEPLISQHASETYMRGNAVVKEYKLYENSETYYWHAPELFDPDEDGNVYPCSKSDVYSLCLVLWESCNAKIPWNTLTYEKLKEQYTLWKAGMPLPQDGTYPGSLLALLQDGLKLERSERIDLEKLQNILQTVKHDIDKLDYIIIPARISKKKSTFSNVTWDTSPTDSDCLSPVQQNIQLKADVHNRDSSTESEKDCSKSDDPVYESLSVDKRSFATSNVPEKCYVSDEEIPVLKYDHLTEKDYSSACSTPITKIRARMKDIGTPNKLHRSDSTEYCSIYSPDNRTRNFTVTDDSVKDQSSVERPAARFSRSFTPKSYKPLHIKVPEYNLNCLKSLPKDKNPNGRSSYNFDIKNYSLPTTPIARSNKLRKNAWLSGELAEIDKNAEVIRQAISKLSNNKEADTKDSSQDLTNNNLVQNINVSPNNDFSENPSKEQSPESVDTDTYTVLKRVDLPESPITSDANRERTNSWSFKSSQVDKAKYKIEEDILANVNVKPLVAIHEKWIFEANRKTGRSMSLPENNRNPIAALKPASHCVDTLQQSLPQLNSKRHGSKFKPSSSDNDAQWTQFCQARDSIAKKMNFGARDSDRHHSWRKDIDKSTTMSEDLRRSEPMIDRATDTHGIEDFIRELIRKELQHIFLEMQDDVSSASNKTEEILDKGVANIMEHLKNNDDGEARKDPVKSFSRVKINGNNKPLLQITFSRCGENSLQVLDNCVNVTFCDSPPKDKNQSLDDTLTDDVQVHSLKRCQAFNALQEARSTEDLYIDDELSTQVGDNFGRMRLIPLHGSLHEILCEKADDCCLIKVKQENGCDTIYFRCDHSDTESRDAIDGVQDIPQDTVVFKRSISLVEERIQRIFPSDKRSTASPVLARKKCRDATNKVRPKSEVLVHNFKNKEKFLSNSSPSLTVKDDAVELNIENVLAYQDSSSEECLKCQAENDDFEYLERKIEEDLANSNISNLSSLTCGCLEKISEENLSAMNEDTTDKESSPDPGADASYERHLKLLSLFVFRELQN